MVELWRLEQIAMDEDERQRQNAVTVINAAGY